MVCKCVFKSDNNLKHIMQNLNDDGECRKLKDHMELMTDLFCGYKHYHSCSRRKFEQTHYCFLEN